MNEAVDAIRGDEQLARRLDEHHLPLWEDYVEFSQLVQTLIAAMALKRPSSLSVASLRQILGLTGGVTARIFTMIESLAVDAIETGEERITDAAVQVWRPIWLRRSWERHRQPAPDFP